MNLVFEVSKNANKNILNLMRVMGVTNEYMAKKLGISTVSFYRKMHKDPKRSWSLSEAAIISKIFNLSIYTIFLSDQIPMGIKDGDNENTFVLK